jgi:hypothetical protein
MKDNQMLDSADIRKLLDKFVDSELPKDDVKIPVVNLEINEKQNPLSLEWLLTQLSDTTALARCLTYLEAKSKDIATDDLWNTFLFPDAGDDEQQIAISLMSYFETQPKLATLKQLIRDLLNPHVLINVMYNTGGHWVGCAIYQNNLYYVDSFSQSFFDRKNTLKRGYKTLIESTASYQAKLEELADVTEHHLIQQRFQEVMPSSLPSICFPKTLQSADALQKVIVDIPFRQLSDKQQQAVRESGFGILGFLQDKHARLEVGDLCKDEATVPIGVEICILHQQLLLTLYQRLKPGGLYQNDAVNMLLAIDLPMGKQKRRALMCYRTMVNNVDRQQERYHPEIMAFIDKRQQRIQEKIENAQQYRESHPVSQQKEALQKQLTQLPLDVVQVLRHAEKCGVPTERVCSLINTHTDALWKIESLSLSVSTLPFVLEPAELQALGEQVIAKRAERYRMLLERINGENLEESKQAIADKIRLFHKRHPAFAEFVRLQIALSGFTEKALPLQSQTTREAVKEAGARLDQVLDRFNVYSRHGHGYQQHDGFSCGYHTALNLAAVRWFIEKKRDVQQWKLHTITHFNSIFRKMLSYLNGEKPLDSTCITNYVSDTAAVKDMPVDNSWKFSDIIMLAIAVMLGVSMAYFGASATTLIVFAIGIVMMWCIHHSAQSPTTFPIHNQVGPLTLEKKSHDVPASIVPHQKSLTIGPETVNIP